MRIAIEMPFVVLGTPGGWIYYTEALLRELAKLDKENEYLVFNFFFRSYREKLARIYCPEAPNFSRLVKRWPDSLVTRAEWGWGLPWIESYLRSQKVKVFHAMRPPCTTLVPFVMISHDIMYLRHPEHMYPAMRWGWEKSGLPGLKLAARVLVHSEYHKRELVEFLKVDEGKIVVTPSGANTSLFFPVTDAERLSEARRRLRLPQRFLMVIGPFLRWWCRYDNAIRAFAAVAKASPDLGLVMIGVDDTPEAKALKDLAESLGVAARVRWPGRLSQGDLLSVMNLALANVYPAWDSGSSLNVLDCMAAGLPVITSRVSLLPEMLGEAGVWADAQSPDELSSAMKRVAEEPAFRKSASEAGLRRARERSWADTARRTLAVYREVGEG